MDIEQIINDLIENNKENFAIPHDEYGTGYIEGYHDALVDLLNQLGIEHDYEYYND